MSVNNRIKKRAVGVIVENGSILLIRRIKDDVHYYVFPGGSVEKGETVEEAVIREMQEELSLKVLVGKLLFKLKIPKNDYDIGRTSYFYLIDDFEGTAKLGGPEKERMCEANQYYPEWVKIADLNKINNLYPVEAKKKVLKMI